MGEGEKEVVGPVGDPASSLPAIMIPGEFQDPPLTRVQHLYIMACLIVGVPP